MAESLRRIQRDGGSVVHSAHGAFSVADTVLMVGVASGQPLMHTLCVATREGRWSSQGLTATRDRLLDALAEDLAYGMARLRADQRAHDAMAQAIAALGSTVELRDPYTAGHQRRVSSIAGTIARTLGWSADQAEGVELAASIHDIGKVAIPAEFLTKPRRLSSLEMALMRTHSEIGAAVLRQIEFPWPIAGMIRQHHERLDGSGYPMGLTGDEITPGAKVIMVADVAEAMSQARPYRTGLGVDAAVAEITRGRGTACDADVVDAFVDCLGGGPIDLLRSDPPSIQPSP